MKAQNLILKCNESKIPNDNEFREFVFQQLDNPNVNYFGKPAANVNKAMEKLADENGLLLNFHFNSPFDIDEDTALEIVTWAFYKKRIEEVKKGNREIEIYLS